MDQSSVDFIPLQLNFSSFTCSVCALAAIILQLVAMECQKLHMVDSPEEIFSILNSYDLHSLVLAKMLSVLSLSKVKYFN